MSTNRNDLLAFMKQVGIGKSGARHLNHASADEAMTAVLEGNYHPVTFGAFFMGLRYKGEQPEELAGFLDAMDRTTVRATIPPPDGLLNCAGAYDGKARTCNIGIPAALVAAAAGVPVALHGARNIPTKYGMATSHVLEALGVNPSRELEAVAHDLHTVGIGYVEQENFHHSMHQLMEARSQMGKRTILNTMETLANPFGATNHLGGFFHDPYAELVCQTVQVGATGFHRAVFVKGIEGSDELRPGSVFVAKIVNGQYSKESVDSDQLGLPIHISELSAPTESIEHRVDFSVRRIRELFAAPKLESAFRNSVLLNAAIRIYAAGKTDELAAALTTATEALDSGAAGEVLARWKDQHS